MLAWHSFSVEGPRGFYIVTRATTTNIEVGVGEGETEYVELITDSIVTVMRESRAASPRSGQRRWFCKMAMELNNVCYLATVVQ